MNNRTKIFLIIVSLIVIIYNVFGFDTPNKKGSAEVVTSEGGAGVVTKAESKVSGKALIGGSFNLIDQNGNEFSSEKLKGKKSIIYFGFTNCPMICPTALSSMTLVMNELGEKSKNFQPVFITTDPERDTAERLKEYLAAFHPSTMGLTGSKESLDEAYRGYKVYAKKVDTGTENYDMAHSSLIYIMDENGEYVSHFSHESKVEDIVKKLNNL